MWQQVSAYRWVVPQWTDNEGAVSDRQILLHSGAVLAELHGVTAHLYEAAGDIDPEQPLAAAIWRLTVEPAPVPDGEGDDVWQALAEIAATPLPAV